MNYDIQMEEQIKTIKEGDSLLLHVCCAPCSSAVLERLGNFFSITCFFYNPNITDFEEYQKRLNELQKFLSRIPTKYPIQLLEGKYQPEEFFKISQGLEEEKERGKRCYLCYQLRLRKTAEEASLRGFSYFATTLTLSPYKNSQFVNEIGTNLDQEYTSTYLYSDFKKKGGYQRSIELSKEYHLYRQDYCGCIYSKRTKKEE